MKNKLTYHFNLPEEREDMKIVLNAHEYRAALINFDEWMRSQLKHNTDNLSEEQIDILQKARDKFYEILGDEEISLY